MAIRSDGRHLFDGVFQGGGNVVAFGSADGGVRWGRVGHQGHPHGEPDDTQRAEHVKDDGPASEFDQDARQRQCHYRACDGTNKSSLAVVQFSGTELTELGAREDVGGHFTALGRRRPFSEHGMERRERDAFAEAHQDTADDEIDVAGSSRQGRGQREHGGGKNTVAEKLARAEQLGQPSAGYLCHDVAPEERAQDDPLPELVPHKLSFILRVNPMETQNKTR